MLIEGVEEAAALLQPLRLQVLSQLAERRSCAQVAEALHETPQKVHYHVKVLERSGLVEKVSERRVRALSEGLYRATARSYWLSPRLVERVGGARQARDAASLEHLLGLSEDLSIELGTLAQRVAAGASVPSLGLSAEVELADPARRAEFLRDVEAAVRAVAEKYGRSGAAPASAPAAPAAPASAGASREWFRLLLACYPRPAADATPGAPNPKGDAT
ncbi:MAG TPA: helix-turn-helix domain-containing protein [Candidatus Eisenbacteria bacterium]|nr:helix-turn-helix domain-containing protein [Candidatus Eisenbacteria bacterium]